MRNCGRRHILRLYLKTGTPSWNKAANGLATWQADAHIYAAISSFLFAAVSDSSRRVASAAQFRLAQTANKLSQLAIIQSGNVFRRNFKHQARPCWNRSNLRQALVDNYVRSSHLHSIHAKTGFVPFLNRTTFASRVEAPPYAPSASSSRRRIAPCLDGLTICAPVRSVT